MFAIVQNGQIVMMVQYGVAFSYNGYDYPANWIQLATPEEKAEIGMVDVVYGQRPNDAFYWVSQDEPVYNAETNQVYVGFTSIPKDIDRLKEGMISSVNNQAYSILLPTDWMVVKAIETGGVVAPAWNTWRQTIRTQAADAVAVIQACTSVDQLAALPSVPWTPDPNHVVVEPVVEEIPAEPAVETPVEESQNGTV